MSSKEKVTVFDMLDALARAEEALRKEPNQTKAVRLGKIALKLAQEAAWGGGNWKLYLDLFKDEEKSD